MDNTDQKRNIIALIISGAILVVCALILARIALDGLGQRLVSSQIETLEQVQ